MKRFIHLLLALASVMSYGQQTVGVFYNDPEAFNGYTLIAATGSDTAYLIDNCGFQVHSWTTENRPALSTYLLENGELLRTGRVNSSVYSGGGTGGLIQKYAWNGDLNWSFEVADESIHQHHDVEAMPNGNVLVLCWGYLSNNEVINNGGDPNVFTNELWPTVVREIEPIYPSGGNVVWEWNLADHFVQDLDSTKLNFGVVADHPELFDINYSTSGNADYLHCNAVNYHPEHDLIAICSRKSSEIFVIDHSTTTQEAASHSGGNRGVGGDFLYRWGNPQNYDRGIPTDQILFGPHDIHWIPDSLPDGGKFMVFNNNGGSSGSAVNVFDPQMSINGDFPDPGGNAFAPINPEWHYEESNFSSGTVSGAQRLPNGGTLVCEGGTGELFELSADDIKVWEYVNPSSASGNLTQGANPLQNSLFRAYRYPVNYPPFIGADLDPTTLIEIDSDPPPCSVLPEPVGVVATSEINPIRVSTLNGQLTIIVDDTSVGEIATIHDLAGKVIKRFRIADLKTRTSMEGWSHGLYILNLLSSDNQRTFKFMNQ